MAARIIRFCARTTIDPSTAPFSWRGLAEGGCRTAGAAGGCRSLPSSSAQ